MPLLSPEREALRLQYQKMQQALSTWRLLIRTKPERHIFQNLPDPQPPLPKVVGVGGTLRANWKAAEVYQVWKLYKVWV
jgi:hypothetical protein